MARSRVLHTVRRLPKRGNPSYRFLTTHPATNCDAIAEQCLRDARLIEQRNNQALPSSSAPHLTTNTSSWNTNPPSPPVTSSVIRQRTQAPSMMGRFQKWKRREKLQWKKEEEDKEEMGAWAFLFIILGIGGASIGGAGGLMQMWDLINRGDSLVDGV